MSDALSHIEEVPDDEDLPESLRWEADPEGPDSERMRDPAESIIHERTGTKVDIHGPNDDGEYSVQAKMGGYNQDAVVQPDAPNQFVSGPTAVVSLGEPDIETARGIALAWSRGWASRTGFSDSIRDLEA